VLICARIFELAGPENEQAATASVMKHGAMFFFMPPP